MISIIVPVYNVEKYIENCIESIVNQTYKNLEILLINDGSTDNSGYICDKWGSKDNRIQVIHQENQGLSDARNVGIKKSKGQYILFVDGDDIIADNMAQFLVETIERKGVDCVFCQYEYINETANKVKDSTLEVDSIKVVTKQESLLRLLNHLEISVVWNGLYKADLIRDLKFMIGKKNEDTAWRYLAVDRCKTIAYIPNRLYGYRMRSGSLMHQKFSLKDFDDLEAVVNRADYLIKKYPQLRYPALTEVVAYCMAYYNNSIRYLNKKDKKEGFRIIQNYRKKYPVKISQILKEKNISKNRKYSVALACISFRLACKIKYLMLKYENTRYNKI